MTAKEAYVILLTSTPGMSAMSCYEYSTMFVFNMVPDGYNGKDSLLNGSYSVNKVTGDVRDFKPFHISIEDYRNGKEVTDFE